jgi:O-antigen ligase
MGAILGVIIFGIPSALIAKAKGFLALRWLVAFGLIGLIVVSCLAGANARGISEEERLQRAAKANKIGAVMAGLCVGLSVLVTLVSLALLL